MKHIMLTIISLFSFSAYAGGGGGMTGTKDPHGLIKKGSTSVAQKGISEQGASGEEKSGGGTST